MTELPNVNVIFNEVFSKEEVEDILSAISREISNRSLVVWDEEAEKASTPHASNSIYKMHADMGRLVIEVIDLPESITNKVNSLASSFGKVRYVSATYCEYNGSYGTPILRMHKDRVKDPNSIHICIDYKIDSNTDWPIVIEGTEFNVGSNQALGFYTNLQEHGRPERKFSENEYVKVIFFYFEVLR